MTSLNPKPYRVVTDTEMGVVRLGSHETLSGAIYAMGIDHGYDNRVSEEYGENPKGVSWIEELVDNEWKEVEFDLG